jgi:hypothetical protein
MSTCSCIFKPCTIKQHPAGSRFTPLSHKANTVLVIGNSDICTETLLSLSGVQWRGVAVAVAIAVNDVTITVNLRGQAQKQCGKR